MNKSEIKKQIDDTIKRIKLNSKDSHNADTLIDKLMSLKGQYDVSPVEFVIDKKDVVKKYDFGATTFTLCKNGILFHAKGGYSVFVDIKMTSLYERLSVMLSMKDRYNELSEDEQDVYNMLYTSSLFNLSLPFLASPDDKFYFGMATEIVKMVEKMQADLDKELQEETYKENAEFEKKSNAYSELLNNSEDESK